MSATRRVAIVTGVGPGIGRSSARALARDGCDVVIAARRAEYLAEVVPDLEAEGARVLAVPTDTGDVAQCRRLVERAVEEFGKLDVVVSSAAKGTPNHTIMNSELSDWEESWLVNVLGPLELCRSAVAQTLAREVGVDGIRVNVVVPGFVPGPNTETVSVSEPGIPARSERPMVMA